MDSNVWRVTNRRRRGVRNLADPNDPNRRYPVVCIGAGGEGVRRARYIVPGLALGSRRSRGDCKVGACARNGAGGAFNRHKILFPTICVPRS